MDYLDIIIKGYLFNKEFLTDYFNRELKKAIKENYTEKEFLFGCNKAIKYLEEDINKQFYERKKELSILISMTKDSKNKLTLEEEKKELSKDFFNVWLPSKTNGRYIGYLSGKEVSFIKNNLNLFSIKLLQEQLHSVKEEYINIKSKTSKQKTTSFNFTGTKNQLKKLHKELTGNFIAKETDYKDFEAVFSNVSIENIKPIKWIDIVKTSKQQANIQTVYELLFLLKSNDLLENKFCTTRNNINNLYKKIDNCFTDGIKEVRFNHIGKKNPDRYSYKPKQNTEKKILLNTIIQSL